MHRDRRNPIQHLEKNPLMPTPTYVDQNFANTHDMQNAAFKDYVVGSAPTPTDTPSRYTGDSSVPTDTSRYVDALRSSAALPTDESTIRQTRLTAAQSRVDAINAYYTDLSNRRTAEERTTGDKLNAEVRVGNVRSGNMGSDIATANSVGQEKTNQANIAKAQADVEAQKNQELTGLYDKIDQSAQDEARANRAEVLGATGAVSQFQDKVKTDRQATVTRLGALGTTVDELKKNPEYYNQILKDTGYSEGELQYELNKSRSDATRIKYDTKVLDDGTVLMYGIDPTTNKLSTTTVDPSIPPGMKPVMKDGTLYYEDQKGTLTPAPIGLKKQQDIANLKHTQLENQKLSQDMNGGGGGNTVTTVQGTGIVAGHKVDPKISGDVEDVLSGRNTLYNIRQTMGRTNAASAYMKSMRDAIRGIDSNFDFVASDAGGKFVSSEYYQKSTAAINSVLPNIDKITQLSDQVGRVGIKGVDSLLQKGQVQIGDKTVSNFREAQKLIADEIGLALGQGTVSDMKLQLGFDVTDPSVSQEVFASNMKVVKDFIENRKKGLEQQRYSSGATKSDTSADPLGIR